MGSMSESLDQQAVAKYHLSRRGAYNSCFRDVWGPREKFGLNTYSPTHPEGLILLRLAENSLLHKDIAEFFREQLTILPTEHLTYSTGPRGSFRLRKSLARYLEKEFESTTPITVEDLFVTPGLTSAIDSVVFALCDQGEGVMVPEPLYNGFKIDITHRADANIVSVRYEELDGYTGFDDVFKPEFTRKALESALTRSRARGIKARAVFVSNPHNPLGRCYPPETMIEFMKFCAANDLHFISDEIYAKSVFENPAIPAECQKFTSALSLDWQRLISPMRFHVLYGASKDFCANGLRLGVVYTKNTGILASMSSIGAFSWAPHALQDVWAAMLDDHEWRKRMHKKNITLMKENYEIITKFMRERDVGYYEMNAGLYIWADFRRFLFPETERAGADFSTLKVGGPLAQTFEKRELRIADICVDKGVMISPGTSYMSSEYGWFRITFTAEKSLLEEGLRRIWKALQDPEVAGWR
ncbi:putative inactive 1-aminocyclopropane-1-carboxylate synthase-like protein 2 [Exophiala dermatitidis]